MSVSIALAIALADTVLFLCMRFECVGKTTNCMQREKIHICDDADSSLSLQSVNTCAALISVKRTWTGAAQDDNGHQQCREHRRHHSWFIRGSCLPVL